MHPADAGSPDRLVGQLGDAATPVGHAVERVVVEGHEHAVGGGVRVGLQMGVTERDRPLEGGGGVLRAFRRSAAVGEGQRPWMVEEGESAAQHDWKYALP